MKGPSILSALHLILTWPLVDNGSGKRFLGVLFDQTKVVVVVVVEDFVVAKLDEIANQVMVFV